MKLKSIIPTVFLSLLCWSHEAAAEDAGLRHINARGTIRCGTNLYAGVYAHKDANGQWHGFDADMCRIFSTAIFGNDKFFEMVDVNPGDASAALTSNKIDVMLGNIPFSANMDITQKIVPVSIMYFDKQMFLAKNPKEADSMEYFKGSTICSIVDSEELYNLDQYNRRFGLKLKIIKFNNPQRAAEAFMLNRCNLLTGNQSYLKSVQKKVNKKDVEILPEHIAVRPIYAYVERDNTQLQSILRWIINGLYLAEAKKVDSMNISTLGGAADISIRNLLGFDDKLWKKFGLKPDWVRIAIKDYGNYAEIYERNFGGESPLQIEREEGALQENGGLIIPQPFL